MKPPKRQDAKDFAKRHQNFFLASLRLGGYICLGSVLSCSTQSESVPKTTSPQASIISGDVSPAPAEATEPQTSTGVIKSEMYQLQMPFRANSCDESFWKLVDEDIVDVPTDVLLNSNGLRVGRGRVSDWPLFLKILQRESAIKIADHRITAQPSVEDAQLDMGDTLPEELLYIYDQHGLTMRSFDDCQNRLSLAFQWAPRKPQTIRVTVCPVVKAWRTRFDYSLADDPPPTKYLEPNNYYDLHFCSDISPGEFLVVGTSRATEDPNRIGSRFLTRDGPNQRYEELLILVGNPVPMNGIKSHLPKPSSRPSAKPAVKSGP